MTVAEPAHDLKTPRRIAVVGGGVSGLVAARLLADDHDVHVFEAAHYVGGHANTIDVEMDGQVYSVDTGFMVFNDRTYPNFIQLLRQLDIDAQASDMSFSVHCERTGVEYQGSSLNGLFAQRRNLLRPSFYRMLADIVRFNREGRALAERGDTELSLGEFLDRGRSGRAFRQQYLVPMISAIWSASAADVEQFPALFLFRFCDNHGLLQLRNRPVWRTIPGGSRRYVAALSAPFAEQIRLRTPVTSVRRGIDADGEGGEAAAGARRQVAVESSDGVEMFDAVVMATHADQTLRILADADEWERQILGAFPYQSNEAVLHSDVSLMPRSRRAWASWNYRVGADVGRAASVTYDLSRLQRVSSPRPILVTLNPTRSIDESLVHRRFNYDHPLFTLAAVEAQARFDEINGPRATYFCGAYRFNGFHEDGVASALEVGAHFGKGLERCQAVSTRASSDTVALAR